MQRTAHRVAIRGLAGALAAMALCLPCAARHARAGVDMEIYLPSETLKGMDTVEAYAISKADKTFGAGDYTKAAVEYKQFIVEFPKSKAIAYALIRQGRCRQFVDKRFDAIKLYNEVLDYFPDDVNCASAALYYIGECQTGNGNLVDAMKAFAELADDKDYSKHHLAPGGVYELAKNLQRQNRHADAVQRFQQLAVGVRDSRPDIAKRSIDEVVFHYVFRSPDNEKLRKFFQDVRGFGESPAARREMPAADDADAQPYWGSVMRSVAANGRNWNAETQGKERVKYYKYWADKMTGKHPGWDEFQIHWIDFSFAADGNAPQMLVRLDEQFSRSFKPGDWSRVISWMELFSSRGHCEKTDEYMKKIAYDRASFDQIVAVMGLLWGCKKQDVVKNTLVPLLDLPKQTDQRKVDMALWFAAKRDVESFLYILDMMRDRDWHDFEFVKFALKQKDKDLLEKKALPMCDRLTKVEKYATDAWWMKADIYWALAKYRECIATLRNFPEPPVTVFYKIADCYVRLNELGPAVSQLREIEMFFPNESSRAVMRIAGVYRGAGKQQQEIAVLHEVMNKYRKSAEASGAHVRLEELGVKIGGGEEVHKD